MKVRYATDEDYPLFAKWWKAHGWEPVHPAMLSPQGIVVTEDGGKPLCVGWFIKTDTKTALFEWSVKDPEVKGKLGGEALDMLFWVLKDLAKEAGYKLFVAFAENERFIKRLVEVHGAQVGDRAMTTIIGKL